MEPHPSISEASGMVMAIRTIQDPIALTEAVRKIISLVGGEIFVFHSRFDKQVFRYLIGCPPAFCQEYNARKWREVDPLLSYAEHYIRPALCGDFKSLSQGQRELIEAGYNAGFRSGIGIPVRHPGDVRLGVLYVGSMNQDMEPSLYAGQGLLIHLANELLDWVSKRILEEEVGDSEIILDSLDKRILRFSYQGFTAEQVAGLCEVPVSRIRQRMRRHIEKLNTNNHRGAVNRAIEMDLLRMHECSDNAPSQQASR